MVKRPSPTVAVSFRHPRHDWSRLHDRGAASLARFCPRLLAFLRMCPSMTMLVAAIRWRSAQLRRSRPPHPSHQRPRAAIDGA